MVTPDVDDVTQFFRALADEKLVYPAKGLLILLHLLILDLLNQILAEVTWLQRNDFLDVSHTDEHF